MSTETSEKSALRSSVAKGYGASAEEEVPVSRMVTSIETQLLHPAVPLSQQVKAVLSLRVVGGLVLVALFVIICTMAEGDEKLFMVKVARPGVGSLADCQTLCQNHRGGVPLSCEDTGHQEWRLRYTDSGFPKTMCSFMVEPPKWQPFLVVGILAFSVALIIDGAPSEIVLLGADVVLVALGVLSESEAYGTLSNKSIIALALLFPIAAAVDDTGALELILGKLLGNPRNLTQAMLRLMVTVSVLSAFLANTAVVAAMLPGIIAWSRRINLSPSLMLMPLSFGAQLGGTTTLIGSSACLVARDATLEFYGGEGMAMFDLTPIGVALAAVVGLACIAFSPLLPRPPPPLGRAADEEAAVDGNMYRVNFVVQPQGALAGRGLDETGIERLPGVAAVKRQAGAGEPLGPSEELTASCTAEGLVALRQVRGLMLVNAHEVDMLGVRRRRRRLFEVAFQASGPLLQRTVTAAHMRRVYGACFLALRRPGHREPLFWRHAGSEEIRTGDLAVLEADLSYVGSLAWSENFALVREIPNSAPPRNSYPSDKPRSVLVCLGLLTLIILVALPKPYSYVSLDYGAGILLLLLLAAKAMSPQDMYAAMKPGVLLTIAGAMGLGTALEKTGVAELLAKQVAGVARLGGSPGIFAAVYVVACGLSMFINNSATIAMVAPMLPTMAMQSPQPIPVKFLALTLVFGAGSCFTTPLGYQTNMMVMADGGYTFTDFMKFGAPVQAVHCICCILLCWGCASMSG